MTSYFAEIKHSEPQHFFSPKVSKANAATRKSFPVLYEQSGSLIQNLPLVLPGDRFEPVSIKVKGQAYSGRLRNFSGVAVREMSEIIDGEGAWVAGNPTESGFILDLGGMRSILHLLVLSSKMKYTLVLPWQGTDFAMAALYPAQDSRVPTRKPNSDGVPIVALRGAESQKLYIQVTGAITLEAFLDACILETLVFPSNLRAALADRPAFWTHPGPLQGETEMLGLAEALTALASDRETGFIPQLSIQSDSAGVLEIPGGFSSLRPEKSAIASWAGSPSTSVFIQAGVQGDFPIHLPASKDGKPWKLRSLKFKAATSLSPWIFSSVTPDPLPSRAAIRIDSRLSVAQPFVTEKATELHGLGLLLESKNGAALSIELVLGDAGRPGSQPPLATCMLQISCIAMWQEVLFEKPLSLAAGMSVWVVVKSKSGDAKWLVAAGQNANAALYAEEGTAWQPYPALLSMATVAGLRIFRTPWPEENQSRVTLSHTDGSTQTEMALPISDDPVEVEWLWNPAALPVLAPSEVDRTINMGIRSLSSGALNIEVATVFFTWKEG